MLVLVGALFFLFGVNRARWERVQQVAALPEWSVDPPKLDPSSPTGYANNQRTLIVPDHHNDSYQWIAQTQQMFATKEWRVRHVDYDNAPFGRESHLPAVYRWWLATAAWGDHVMSHRPIALAVEHAALWVQPLTHALFLLATTWCVARWFGALSAALVAVGTVGFFPLASCFLPGAPDHRGLLQLMVLWSVLPLVEGVRRAWVTASVHEIRPTEPAPKRADVGARRLFFAAGVFGGLAMWLGVDTELPVLGGIGAGSALATWFARRTAQASPNHGPLPWRLWAVGGALTSLVAYMLEYYPGHMALRFDLNHPLYAIGWLGAGELFTFLPRFVEPRKPRDHARKLWTLVAAVGAVSAVPVTIATFGMGSELWDTPLAAQLTTLNGGVIADNFAKWLARDGVDKTAWATALPVIALVPGFWLLFRRTISLADRAAIAIATGPVVVAAALACAQLRWWNTTDSVLLGLVAITGATLVGTAPKSARWALAAVTLTAAGLGAALLVSRATTADGELVLTESEVHSVVERDFAHWLAQRAGPNAVVVAPPDMTTSLAFHGGLRGIGTMAGENKDGLRAAVRIVSATSPDEGRELLRNRQVTHIVIPSWDLSLDEFARMGSSAPEGSFVAILRRWALPPWVRPLAYTIPRISGVETQSLLVFAVVDDQDDATATIGLAEYFVEAGRADLATALLPNLRRYPSVLAAKVAVAEVAFAGSDAATFNAEVTSLLPVLKAGGDRTLRWDRRVALAIVLAQGKQIELAKEQVRRCAAQATEAQVRALTTGALFRFQLLCKASGVEIADTRVRALARSLLPPDLRKRTL